MTAVLKSSTAMNAGITMSNNEHAIHVAQDGNDLLITANWLQNYCMDNGDRKNTVLTHSGGVTMRIDLMSEPTAYTVQLEGKNGQIEERVVYMPKFTIENGGCQFHTDYVN